VNERDRNGAGPSDRSAGFLPAVSRAECSAGGPPAVARAARPRWGAVTIRDRGRLPHWEIEGGTYFVTFRLADSLPEFVVHEIENEKHRLLSSSKKLNQGEQKKIERACFAKLEKYLDAGIGNCWLKRTNIAQIVADNLLHFNGKRYELLAWCVMPNHLHVAFKSFPSFKLAQIVQSWKSFTAKAVNAKLKRTGAFWQREYFDRLIRDERELHRTISYIARNPEKAGLQDWKWVWTCGPAARGTAGQRPALRQEPAGTPALQRKA
jgi:REP element-mobilizing transposase RayT